jgi:hypothetical protein
MDLSLEVLTGDSAVRGTIEVCHMTLERSRTPAPGYVREITSLSFLCSWASLAAHWTQGQLHPHRCRSHQHWDPHPPPKSIEDSTTMVGIFFVKAIIVLEYEWSFLIDWFGGYSNTV